MTVVSLLREMESQAPMQRYIDFIASLEEPSDKGDLCAEALLTGKPAKDAQGNTIAVFAMPPNEAAVVLRVQEYSAVIATIN